MKSRFRVYLTIISAGSLALFGAGIYLQAEGVRVIAASTVDAGIAEIGFGLVITAVSLALLVFGWRAIQLEATLATRKEAFPAEKWRWRSDWADGQFVDRMMHPGAIVGIAGFVALVALLTSYRTYVSGGLDVPSNEVVLAIVVVLSGGLIAIATIVSRKWAQFGETRFDLEGIPVRIGGDLTGVVVTNISPEYLEQSVVEATLVCSRIYRQNRRHNRTAANAVVWRSTVTIAPRLGMRSSDSGRVTFPVSIALPDDTPESTVGHKDEEVEWRLDISARRGRSSNKSSFTLPVFHAGAESELIAARAANRIEAAANQQSLSEPDVHVAVHGLSVCRVSGTTTIDVAPTKRFSFAAATIAFGLVWAVIVGYLVIEQAPRLLTILASSFSLVPVYGVICIWFERTQLLVNSQGIIVRRQIGPVSYKRTIPAHDIKELLLSSFANVGSTNYFDLILLTNRGKRLLVVGRLAGQSSIEWIGFQINAALGRCSRVAFSGTVIGRPTSARPLPDGAPDRGPQSTPVKTGMSASPRTHSGPVVN